MSCKYLIRQEVFGDGINKLIAIRPDRESAMELIAYLHTVDPKNTYYYHSDTEPRSDTR
jgi:hypothetical protein